MLGTVRYWQDMGADGFRLDAVTSYFSGNNEKNVEFLKWIRSVCEKKDEDAYIVGEVWADRGTIFSYYKSGLDSFFNFPFSRSEGVMIANGEPAVPVPRFFRKKKPPRMRRCSLCVPERVALA
jgi:glycosidase